MSLNQTQELGVGLYHGIKKIERRTIMSVWLARNKSFNKEDSFYQMFQSKPVKLIDGSDIDFHPSFGKRSFKLGLYCPSLMHKLSNMKLKPGTCVKLKAVTFTV